MSSIIKIPKTSIISKDIEGNIDYIDSFSVEINHENRYSIDYLTALLFTSIPPWANSLFKIRDALVKLFGLQTGLMPEQNSILPEIKYCIGEKAIFFTVINKSSNEMVMAEDDKHLYFRTSLHIEAIDPGHRALAHLTTLVQFHNKHGEIYFLPVKPFHKMLMKSILNRFAKKLCTL